MTDQDKAMHRGLMKLLDEADFTLKAREVAAFIQIYNWTKELPNKMKQPEPVKKKTRRKTK